MPKYKHGKITTPIELDLMLKVLKSNRFQKYRHRSYLAFLYLTGVRRSEALETVKEDYTIEEKVLVVKIPAKKGGVRDILKLRLDLPFMDLILERLEETGKGGRLWTFSDRTALRIVKRAMGDQYYPHFFRLNRAVHFLDDPETTDPEMMSWFGWKSRRTIDSYMGFSQRHLDKQADRLKERV